MRTLSILTASLSLGSSMAAFAQPDPLGVIWQRSGVSLVRTGCRSDIANDQYCRAIELVHGPRRQILGEHYMHVELLWSRRVGSSAPDVLVFGNDGGSGGSGDLFAVTLGAKPIVTKFRSERLDQVRPNPDASVLRLDLPFEIGYFNGAPHAGVTIVPIPTVWTKGDFAVDLGALVRGRISKQETNFRELAMREELQAWRDENFPTSRLYPPQAHSGTPVTLQALADLTLSGHANNAKVLLDRAWPNSFGRTDEKLGGKHDFWKSFCRAVVQNPLWTRLDLQRLPHSDVITRE